MDCMARVAASQAGSLVSLVTRRLSLGFTFATFRSLHGSCGSITGVLSGLLVTRRSLWFGLVLLDPSTVFTLGFPARRLPLGFLVLDFLPGFIPGSPALHCSGLVSCVSIRNRDQPSLLRFGLPRRPVHFKIELHSRVSSVPTYSSALGVKHVLCSHCGAALQPRLACTR